MSTKSAIEEVSLGDLFEERKYLFSVKGNLRDYEWEQEALRLLDDFCSGDMLDLSMVSITPIRDSDLTVEQKKIIEDQLQKCKFYTIIDGQQRVTTICIIYAALRDTILHCGTVIETSADMKTVLEGSIEAIAPIGLVRSDPRYPRVTSNSSFFKDLMLRGDGSRGVEIERPAKMQRAGVMDEDQRLDWVYKQCRQYMAQMIGPMFENIDRAHGLLINLQYNANTGA